MLISLLEWIFMEHREELVSLITDTQDYPTLRQEINLSFASKKDYFHQRYNYILDELEYNGFSKLLKYSTKDLKYFYYRLLHDIIHFICQVNLSRLGIKCQSVSLSMHYTYVQKEQTSSFFFHKSISGLKDPKSHVRYIRSLANKSFSIHTGHVRMVLLQKYRCNFDKCIQFDVLQISYILKILNVTNFITAQIYKNYCVVSNCAKNDQYTFHLLDCSMVPKRFSSDWCLQTKL